MEHSDFQTLLHEINETDANSFDQLLRVLAAAISVCQTPPVSEVIANEAHCIELIVTKMGCLFGKDHKDSQRNQIAPLHRWQARMVIGLNHAQVSKLF